MNKTRYRGYFSEEIIESSPYAGVTSPAVYYNGDSAGDDLTFSFNCVTHPMTLENVPNWPARDQFILFAGSNLDDFHGFGATVRLFLGPEKAERTITGPRLVYIPAGLTYGPLEFADVRAPVVWMNFFIAPQFSKPWTGGGDYDAYLATPSIVSEIFHTQTHVAGNLLSEQKWPKQEMVVTGDALGPQGANFCLFYYAIAAPYYMMEPAHAHDQHMWLINLGGDARNVADFDAEVGMWWGEEAEKLVTDGVSVTHVPPGLLHRGLFFDPVRKPYVHIHTYTAPSHVKALVVDEHITGAKP